MTKKFKVDPYSYYYPQQSSGGDILSIIKWLLILAVIGGIVYVGYMISKCDSKICSSVNNLFGLLASAELYLQNLLNNMSKCGTGDVKSCLFAILSILPALLIVGALKLKKLMSTEKANVAETAATLKQEGEGKVLEEATSKIDEAKIEEQLKEKNGGKEVSDALVQAAVEKAVLNETTNVAVEATKNQTQEQRQESLKSIGDLYSAQAAEADARAKEENLTEEEIKQAEDVANEEHPVEGLEVAK